MMKKKGLVVGLVLILIILGLSGCVGESPVSKGNAKFTIGTVTITSELETYDSWTNETKTVVSNNSKFIIISITIENKDTKILHILEGFGEGLSDDEGNDYYNKMYVEIDNSTYSVESITSIEREDLFDSIVGMSTDISPNSIVLKKMVYQIPLDRTPEKLSLAYGFKANELTSVEDWYHITMSIPI
jgi:hypothetical protein